MGMIVESPENRVTHEDGEYLAKFIDYEDLGMMADPFNEGKEKHRCKLVFELPDGATQWDWCTVSLHPQAKLYEVASCLLGTFPPKKLDLDTLKGKSCLITIESTTTQEGRQVSKIRDYRKAPKNQNFKRPPTQQSMAVATAVREEVVEEQPITDDDIPF